jgi:DNA replication protein DnaC
MGRILNNLIFLGPPGVGKTHLFLALAKLSLDAGYKVFFTSMDRLIHILKTSEVSKSSGVRLKYIYTCDLVIVDELGYLPVTRNETNMFFQMITRLYDKASLIITSNKGFEGWADIFGDTVCNGYARQADVPLSGHTSFG